MDSRAVTENPAVYSPHLKKVLKSFQLTSMRSLNGPDTRPVYGLGYSLHEKNLTSSLLSSFSVSSSAVHHGKSNLISTDGVFYKKRLKGSSSVAVNGTNGSVVSNGVNQNQNAASTKNSLLSMTGDSNNNSNEASSTSANNKTVKIASKLVESNGASKSNGVTDKGSVEAFGEDRDGLESDLFLGPPPFPIQQVPILTAADQGWSESKTQLEGEMISCFVVGGEKRLCLPQILNTVLRDFSLPQINAVCDELQIYCSRCNQEQLGVLKMAGILPPSAPSCGLVTKTDCERLCNALLHYPPRALHNIPAEKRPFHFRIYHECFGKCEGIFTPDHFTGPDAKCIECSECHGLMSPQKFVGHVHRALENRTCHWGFDSTSWRYYILVAKGQDNMNHLKDQLDEMKEKFDNTKNNQKRKQLRPMQIKAEIIEVDDEECRTSSGGQPHVSVGEDEEDLEVKEDAPVIKKRKTDITDTYYPYVYDPVACYYGLAAGGGPFPHHANPSALSRLSAFRPWSPLLTTKEGKFNLNMPPNTVAFTRDSAPPLLPAYLSRGPPVLLNPERVVPISETERFERHYQPNVALAPPSAQIQAKQKSHQSSHVNESSVQRASLNLAKQQLSPVNNNKRIAESAVASSTTSSSQQPVQPRGYSDIELSTDTDETFSDSTTYSASGSPTLYSTGNPVSSESQEKLSSEIDVFVTEMKLLHDVLEEDVPERNVRDKVLTRVARICCSLEQKLQKSESSSRQLQKVKQIPLRNFSKLKLKNQIEQELEFMRMSKRERLREALETKRQLRKDLEQMYQERLRLERQIDELKKDSQPVSSSLQRKIVLKREQIDEEEPQDEEHLAIDINNAEDANDTLEEAEDEEANQQTFDQAIEDEEVEDVKPNVGLLQASVSSGY